MIGRASPRQDTAYIPHSVLSVEDYHSDAFISNLVTSTLVTIFCRLQKDFKIKSRLKSPNFLSCYYVLRDFDKFDSIRLFWESSNSVEGGFDWRKLCYSNKHFVAGWNEFCRPNSTKYPGKALEDVLREYLFHPALILRLRLTAVTDLYRGKKCPHSQMIWKHNPKYFHTVQAKSWNLLDF